MKYVMASLAIGLTAHTTLAAEGGLTLNPVRHLDEVGNPLPSHSSDYGVTGDWWGFRNTLTQHHVHVGATLIFDTSKYLRGGWNTRNWDANYLFDLHVLADLEGAFGWSGGTAYASFQSHDQSSTPDSFTPDAQGRDNISAPAFSQIAQLWYRHELAEGIRIKIGKIDANTDAAVGDAPANDGFSFIEHGLDFISSATSYPTAMAPLPSYPEGAPGVSLFVGSEWYAGFGAYYSNSHQTFLNFSGHPEKAQPASGGMFLIAEAGARWMQDSLPGHAGAGVWYHCGSFPLVADTGGAVKSGNKGAYIFIDQSVFYDAPEDGPVRDIGLFFLAGMSDEETNFISRSAAGGITLRGFVPHRPEDCFGAMVAWAHLNYAVSQGFNPSPTEIAAELFYHCQVTSWASIKPAIQYITKGPDQEQDQIVAVVRLQVDF